MHPDQKTPDSHRHSAADSHTDAAPASPEQDQQIEVDTTETTVSTPEPDGARVAEAGHSYVGRMMDDTLKANPRVEDGDEAVDGDPATPGDE